MRVLMVAPQPFFSPRGTPFSVLNRCRALTALGHQVDLVTYPLGKDVDLPGLKIIRAPRVPGIKSVKIGPSPAKLPLDAGLFLRTLIQLRRRRYDVIHTHEEAGAFGWWLSRVTRIPHLYDMHSDLAQQLTNFGFTKKHPLVRFAAWLERRVLRSAQAVIVICPDLADRVAAYTPGLRPTLIENAPLDPPLRPGAAAEWRKKWCPGEGSVILYAGTLEPYQGVPLLLDAISMLPQPAQAHPARLVLVGGRPDQIDDLRSQALASGLEDRVIFVGQRPHDEMPACFAAADVLVSPRNSGTNTPLKIYSYLQSGRPIVATRLLTHTQVLDDSVAVLVEPTAVAISRGIQSVLEDPEMAARIGHAAYQRAIERYSPQTFLELTAKVYAQVGGPPVSEVNLTNAASVLAE
jgi:glycosyltransferase involved in cell wall biosynthesis